MLERDSRRQPRRGRTKAGETMLLAQADQANPRPDRGARRETTQPRAETLTRDGLPATEVVLAFDDNRLASLVFGQYDQNLAHLERRLGVVVNPNGNHVTIRGPRFLVTIASNEDLPAFSAGNSERWTLLSSIAPSTSPSVTDAPALARA